MSLHESLPAIVVVHRMKSHHPAMRAEARIASGLLNENPHQSRLVWRQGIVIRAVEEIRLGRIEAECLECSRSCPGTVRISVKIELRGARDDDALRRHAVVSGEFTGHRLLPDHVAIE